MLRWALERLPGDPALVEAVLALLAPGAGDARVQAVEALLATQPGQDEMRAAREARYRAAEMWEPLADLLLDAAEHEVAPTRAAARLREAAGIHKAHLFDFATAAELLRKARALDPHDVDLVADLTRLLVELGEPQKALAETLVACRTPDLPPDGARPPAALPGRHAHRARQARRGHLGAAGGAGRFVAEAKKEILAKVERLRAGAAPTAASAPRPSRRPAPPPTTTRIPWRSRWSPRPRSTDVCAEPLRSRALRRPSRLFSSPRYVPRPALGPPKRAQAFVGGALDERLQTKSARVGVGDRATGRLCLARSPTVDLHGLLHPYERTTIRRPEVLNIFSHLCQGRGQPLQRRSHAQTLRSQPSAFHDDLVSRAGGGRVRILG